MTGDDVREAARALVDALTPATANDWTTRAGSLRWTSNDTIRHVNDCLLWYALNFSGRTTSDGAWDFATVEAPAKAALTLTAITAAVLADAVDNAPPHARGWHPFGMADASGFAAMGCDEILVHGFDVGAGVGAEFSPPRSLCGRVVYRLFPWAPSGFDPWDTLLWCNGRRDLPGHARLSRRWVWHCAPLSEWDGAVPKWIDP